MIRSSLNIGEWPSEWILSDVSENIHNIRVLMYDEWMK